MKPYFREEIEDNLNDKKFEKVWIVLVCLFSLQHAEG